MTAGNHKIIIEKGADFKIDLQVSENGIDMKDLTGYTIEMVIKYADEAGAVQTLDTIAGALIEDTPGSGTYLNGYCEVIIDKAVTATYPTRVGTDLNAFATEYNYHYHIEVTEDVAVSAGKENLRILRGKAAIRE